jgi:hypothetical protein
MFAVWGGSGGNASSCRDEYAGHGAACLAHTVAHRYTTADRNADADARHADGHANTKPDPD